MKNFVIFLLVITNAITGILFLDREEKVAVLAPQVAAMEETRTSDFERNNYGAACVDWHKEEGEKGGKREGEFYLGRSWRKHGQMVFEVIVPKDETGKLTGDALCTYDLQSGMMYSYTGPARQTWLFY